MTGDGGFETRAIHAGQEPDPSTGSVTTPIFQTSTYAQAAVGDHQGYEYSRTGNPTRAALEECLASLEEAAFGRAFSSGMAAEDALLRTLLKPGDHAVIPHDAYGGTFRLLDKVLKPIGIEFDAVDLADLDALGQSLRPSTKVVCVETPTNPMLAIADIAAVSEIAHASSELIRVVVDNTFASPYLQRPLTLGADAVVHSTTKYVGGHSDIVGGFVGTNDEAWDAEIGFLQNAVGGVPAPLDCFLALRGLKTLAVRMERHCTNAAAVAERLSDHPAVEQVLYPGLPSHPGHDIAAKQMDGFGGMVSFLVRGGEPTAHKVAAGTKLFTMAESLGAVESLIEQPAAMTHSAGSLPRNLLRLSVGLETIDDLLADLEAALSLV
jgi:cystathionine gamma-synthase